MKSTRHQFLASDARKAEFTHAGEPALVVTSPPYPMITMWDEAFGSCDREIPDLLDREDGQSAFERMHAVLDEVWKASYAALVGGGILCVNIGDAVRTLGGGFRLYANVARVSHALERTGFTLLPPIIWRKQSNSPTKFMGSGMLPGGAYVTLEHESILIARKGELRRPTSREEKDRRRQSAIFWEERNEWYSDLWSFAGVRQQLAGSATSFRERSGAYPLELAYRLIAMHSWLGDLVLDPFAGTGTTAAGAMALARSSLSLELDPELARSSLDVLGNERTTGILRARAETRLEAHRSFVTETRRETNHTNGPHSVPVVTSQETDLEVPLIAGIERNGELLTCSYESTPVESQC